MQCPEYDVAKLLPQSGNMVLIDCIESYGEDFLIGYSLIAAKHVLLQEQALPAWAVLEIMAQGIAAFAGVRAHDAGEKVRLGFLLGSRKLEVFFDKLPINSKLGIKVQRSIEDEQGFGVFDCELTWRQHELQPATEPLFADGFVLAKASLNVFSPQNVDDFIRKQK